MAVRNPESIDVPGELRLESCEGSKSDNESKENHNVNDMISSSLNRSRDNGREYVHISQLQTTDAPAKVRSKVRMIAVMAAIYLSLFIAALDQTIVATAIPTISSELHSASGYTWIGGAYLLANAAAAPIWSKLSDIWGRKPIFLCAVAFFAASSIVCATSTSMKMLIVGRAFQGTAAGGLMQLVNITISDIFSMRSRSLYLGLLEAMWAIAGGVGPILGGAFTELVSWRWNFWINLPISGISFLLLLLFLDVHNPRTRVVDGLRAIDWFGSLSILGLTVMLLLGLNFGGTTFPWNSPQVICLIIFGALMSLLFIWSEKRLAQYPLMPLALFSKPATAASLVVAFIHGFVFIAAEYYLPLYFQSVASAGPLRSGVLILPVVVSEAAMGIATGIIIHQTGRYQELIWIGLSLLTIGNGLLIHLGATTSIVEIIISQLVVGIASGMLFEPPLIAIQAQVAQDETATTTATFSFIRNLATSSSIVIGGVVFQNGMELQAMHLQEAGLSANLTQAFSGRAAAANVILLGTIKDPTQEMIVKEAFSWSLRNMWILYTCISCLGILASLFITKKHLSREHTETKTGVKKEQHLVSSS